MTIDSLKFYFSLSNISLSFSLHISVAQHFGDEVALGSLWLTVK